MSERKSDATPWSVVVVSGVPVIASADEMDDLVVYDPELTLANAELIVRAVNAYDAARPSESTNSGEGPQEQVYNTPPEFPLESGAGGSRHSKHNPGRVIGPLTRTTGTAPGCWLSVYRGT